jgi:single-strand DNA-binding protein
MAKSLNKVQLIGNLTRDPELRYTEQGTAVCTFGLATNRNITTKTGEKTEEVDFHRIVAWRELAQLCDKYLSKGKQVYVAGYLHTRSYTGKDGKPKTLTEVVIDDIILLSKREPRVHV